jgi:hypothetical protein
MRFFATLFAVVAGYAAFSSAGLLFTCIFFMNIAKIFSKAPVEVRQIGDIQCNVARLGVVGSLGKAKSAASKLASTVAYAKPLTLDNFKTKVCSLQQRYFRCNHRPNCADFYFGCADGRRWDRKSAFDWSDCTRRPT